jgi:NADH:ubiquinone oxidoreductase subunit F (NADH-binding)
MRLIADEPDLSSPTLAAHRRRHGALRLSEVDSASWSRRLLEEIERSGLIGRGGGGFPSFKKLRLVETTDPAAVLLVNAMEGEPASMKDRFLVMRAPHLILDGAEFVAAALGSTRIVLCVPRDASDLVSVLNAALEERSAAGDSRARIEVRRLSGRYVAGEESALVAGVAGKRGLPSYRPDKSVPLTIGRRPAIVHNVETLANVALIARYGSDWFRQVGVPEAPGTRLVTISGSVQRPGVIEVVTGTRIDQILEVADPIGQIQAVLVGGYGGTWIPQAKMATAYAPLELSEIGASMGAGVLVALAASSCGIAETACIARFMAAESAGQCGPCLFGLPAIADDLQSITHGRGDRRTLEPPWSLCGRFRSGGLSSPRRRRAAREELSRGLRARPRIAHSRRALCREPARA